MTALHSTVGNLVVIGYVLLLILNIRTAVSGGGFSWQRGVSYGAATLLLLQYVLGFSLLAEGRSVTAVHFLIALAAILPIGLEHGYANAKPSARTRGRYAALANILTLALILVAYIIGQSN